MEPIKSKVGCALRSAFAIRDIRHGSRGRSPPRSWNKLSQKLDALSVAHSLYLICMLASRFACRRSLISSCMPSPIHCVSGNAVLDYGEQKCPRVFLIRMLYSVGLLSMRVPYSDFIRQSHRDMALLACGLLHSVGLICSNLD